jgi:hypothetical protein
MKQWTGCELSTACKHGQLLTWPYHQHFSDTLRVSGKCSGETVTYFVNLAASASASVTSSRRRFNGGAAVEVQRGNSS